MTDQIRMNQKIVRAEDPEIYDYLNGFGERARAAQARKLMLLGLVELSRLSGGQQAAQTIPSPTLASSEDIAAANDEQSLIVESGLSTLF